MLKGKKIYLRSVEKRDMSIFYSFCEEEEVRKYDGGHKIMPALERVMEYFDEITNNRRNALSIINEKNVLVGYMTFKEKMDTINVYSIGITIGSRYWNRGYGKDSINTLLDYLFMYRAAQRVELEVVDYNERAINCYKSCGFIIEGTKRKGYFYNGQYHNIYMMAILSDEYKKKIINK